MSTNEPGRRTVGSAGSVSRKTSDQQLAAPKRPPPVAPPVSTTTDSNSKVLRAPPPPPSFANPTSRLNTFAGQSSGGEHLPNYRRSRPGLIRRFKLYLREREQRRIEERAAQVTEARRKAPSWLVSLIVHIVLLIILALIPIGNLTSGALTFFLVSGNTLTEASFELSDSAELGEIESDLDTREELAPVEQLTLTDMIALETPVELGASDVPVSSTLVLESLPHGLANGLVGRSGDLKAALLQKFGGSAETEEAVELGLAWLAKQQLSDGSWSLVGPYFNGGTFENKTAATALALNAFLGAGYSHKEGKYATAVKSGLEYLVRRQDDEGFFAKGEPERQYMYAQAIATIAVTEAYGMTGDSKYRIAAERAMKYAVWSQCPDKGWRYRPRDKAGSDLSVTGWFLMALMTGKMAGLDVKEDVIKSVGSYLNIVSHEDYSRYSYTDVEGPDLSMTSVGILCRIYLGWPRTHPALLAAVQDDFLPNVPSGQHVIQNVYYYYYATQVLHHVGGQAWNEWNQAMKSFLPAIQVRQGREIGSWGPDQDAFGAAGGRLYTTCLNIYCLEVYYRHLSLYDLEP
ncbi:MAG: hypothetical protein KDB03_08055 [Planctomycetales bacterium]|nr:hypothetical protein [Planctomycetales bacterium]